MIVHELKTIFIHIPRTGGTSIEIALAGNNWFKIDPATKHIDHVQAKQVYADYWDDYHKFTVVRDPFEWLASLYYSHNRGGDKTWDEFVRAPNLFINEQQQTVQSDIIGDDIDQILRFEMLSEDFALLCRNLGVERTLTHAQNSSEGTFEHYSELYSDEQRRIATDHFQRDLDRFHYRFIPPEVAAKRAQKQTISNLKQQLASLQSDYEAIHTQLAEAERAIKGALEGLPPPTSDGVLPFRLLSANRLSEITSRLSAALHSASEAGFSDRGNPPKDSKNTN
ncbi:MAG: sulfotransferase family 2 domain-containing protein [Proteobacteria bacterium]|nr:sulfotransferase family 2 domain-containing protein [Pseudomonadota bacterium]MDA1302660.1 sulfotransferase family 2 domain-containing protein [Pseudomonadota bacterium]